MGSLRESAERLVRMATRVCARLGSESSDSKATPYPVEEGSERAMRVLREDFLPAKLKTCYNRFRGKYSETFHQCAGGTHMSKIFYIYWFMRTIRNIAEYVTQRFDMLMLNDCDTYVFNAETECLVPQIEAWDDLEDDTSRDPIQLRRSNLDASAWNRACDDAKPMYEIHADSAAETARMMVEATEGVMYQHRWSYRLETLTLLNDHAILQHVRVFWASNIFTSDTVGVQQSDEWQERTYAQLFVKRDVLPKMETMRQEADAMVCGIEEHLALQGVSGSLFENDNDQFCLQYQMPLEFASVCGFFQKYSVNLRDSCAAKDPTPEGLAREIRAMLQSCVDLVLTPLRREHACVLRHNPETEHSGSLRIRIGEFSPDKRFWRGICDSTGSPLERRDADTFTFVNPLDASRIVYSAISRTIDQNWRNNRMHRMASVILTSCAPGDLVCTVAGDGGYTCTIAQTHVERCIEDIESALRVR